MAGWAYLLLGIGAVGVLCLPAIVGGFNSATRRNELMGSYLVDAELRKANLRGEIQAAVVEASVLSSRLNSNTSLDNMREMSAALKSASQGCDYLIGFMVVDGSEDTKLLDE